MAVAVTLSIDPDLGELDRGLCWPLLVMLACSMGWLFLSGILDLVNLLQLLSPNFFSGYEPFVYGRVQAMAETSFDFGWAANTSFAVTLWILSRLGGERLYLRDGLLVSILFWNVGVSVAIMGLAGFSLFATGLLFPAFVEPFMLVAMAAIAGFGVVAWERRRQKTTFVAQWYALAALLLPFGILVLSQVMARGMTLRGVMYPIAEGWCNQNKWALWFAPAALAFAYYIMPKVTGCLIPNYKLSQRGFWCLIVVGSWSGGRFLSNSPVPVWMSSVGIIACVLLVFHYLVVWINLRPSLGLRGPILRWVGLGVLTYIVGGLVEAVTSLRTLSVYVQFTWLNEAQRVLLHQGAFSFILFGAIYYILPRLVGRSWPSSLLINLHWAAMTLGTFSRVLAMGIGGVLQTRDLMNPAISYAEIAQRGEPWLYADGVSQWFLLLGNLVVLAHSIWLLRLRRRYSLNQLSRIFLSEKQAIP